MEKKKEKHTHFLLDTHTHPRSSILEKLPALHLLGFRPSSRRVCSVCSTHKSSEVSPTEWSVCVFLCGPFFCSFQTLKPGVERV